MGINRFGMNLDEGIPLTEKTFEKLYVSCFDETVFKIADWIRDNTTDTPLLFGGQIGAGKTTLLTKIFSDTNLKPDIILKFDKDGLNLEEGDFLGIVLAGFIKRAMNQKIDLSFSKLPAEIFGLSDKDWPGIFNILCPGIFSLKAFENKISARKKISGHTGYIIENINKIGEKLQKKTDTPLFICASGLDKYNPKKHAFKLSLHSSVNILSKYKTLYEVNAVHLFMGDNTSLFSFDCPKIFIQTMDDKKTLELLEKRMGVYAEPIRQELEIIAQWAGGNPRQAIRLLTHYQSAKKNNKSDKTGWLANAIKRTTNDLFAFANRPSADLIKIISKDKSIQSSLFYLAGDKETALESLYGNWIFITGDSDNGSWPAIVNPLVKPFFRHDKTLLQEPEQKLLLNYARTNDMSPYGIGFNMLYEDNSEKSADELLQEFFSIGIEEPLSLNIVEVLEIISAALLSRDRKDRIIIAYQNADILNAARAYLFAKANSYEYQRVEHVVIQGGENKKPINKLEQVLNLDIDIISLDFSGQFTKKQIESFDKYRDRLIDYQMLWWIQIEDLKEYLPDWVQLRELFEIFILEDELLKSLSIQEIESDLAFFQDMVESETSSEFSVVANLKIVLEYLRQNRGGRHG